MPFGCSCSDGVQKHMEKRFRNVIVLCVRVGPIVQMSSSPLKPRDLWLSESSVPDGNIWDMVYLSDIAVAWQPH